MLADSITTALKDLGKAAIELRSAVEQAGDRLPDLTAAAVLLQLDKMTGRLRKLAGQVAAAPPAAGNEGA